MKSHKKILVVSLDNIGDCVMASCLLRPLRRLYPNAHIGLWVKEYAQAIFSPSECLDQIHAADPFWDKSPGRSKGSFSSYYRTLKEIRNVNYDLAFVLNADWRRGLSCQLAGISERVGYNRKRSNLFLTKSFPLQSDLEHMTQQHKFLFSSYFNTELTEEDQPFLTVTQDDKDWVKNWKKSIPESKNIFALHLFSGDIKKNWPLENWSRLIELIKKNHPDSYVVIMCSPAEAPLLEKHMPNSLADEISKGAPLSELKSLLSGADYFIGGDSGPGHIAAALGTPVLSLFSRNNWKRYQPMGQNPVKVLFSEKFKDTTPEVVFKGIPTWFEEGRRGNLVP